MGVSLHPPLSARIHAELRGAILSGRYAPGDALASERQLSERLGAGRHAVREALKRLEEAGLVRISHGGATRVRDWRHSAGLDLLLALGADNDVPPELELARATLEMRACVGADAARLCAQRAGAVQRAQLRAAAEALAAERELLARNAIYERLWDLVIEGAANIAYRLALNTLLAGQHILVFDAELVADELGDPQAIRAMTTAIAAGDAERAGVLARALLQRSVPGG